MNEKQYFLVVYGGTDSYGETIRKVFKNEKKCPEGTTIINTKIQNAFFVITDNGTSFTENEIGAFYRKLILSCADLPSIISNSDIFVKEVADKTSIFI